MGVPVTTDELSELDDPILHDLREQNAAAYEELKRQIEMIHHEFRSQFPQLEMVPQLSIDISTMKEWLARHVSGGVPSCKPGS